jgi:DNA modification methylase
MARERGADVSAPRKEILAEGVELWLGDCREVLPTLGPVDAVVTDPPYGVSFGWAKRAIFETSPTRSARTLTPPTTGSRAENLHGIVLPALNAVLAWAIGDTKRRSFSVPWQAETFSI